MLWKQVELKEIYLTTDFNFFLSSGQIDFVDSLSFKDILCLTVDNLPEIQPFVFLTSGVNNTKEACNTAFHLEGWELISDSNQIDETVALESPNES